MASLVLTVGLGPAEDRVTYQFWCMHDEGERFATGLQLKRRATEAGITGDRRDREHMARWSTGLPAELVGKFPTFTHDLDGDVLVGYMHTDGFDRWCYDQAELKGSVDSRTLFAHRVPNELPPPCT